MIKEESQDGDFLFSHADAGPHSLFVRVRNIRLIPSLEYDSSAASFSFHPDVKKTKQKKRQPPGHSGLKFWLVTTLRATRSLRSLKQALRLTPPARISPFGHRPPFQWAGSCTSAYLCRAFFKCTSLLLPLLGQTVRTQAHFKNFLRILRGRKCDAYVQGMLERAHILRAPFPHARGSFALPLRGSLGLFFLFHLLRPNIRRDSFASNKAGTHPLCFPFLYLFLL